MLRRASRGATGRAVHLLGLPLAAFVGSYTGVLLASTSTPSWARRAGWLGPLFLSSGLSSGLAAVTLAGTLGGGLDAGARRRIARAETVALACELGLTLGAHRATRDLPSERGTPPIRRVMRAAMLGLGMAVPLGIAASHAAGRRRHRRGRGGRSGLLGAGLTLAGSLALRYLATDEGYRSASTAEDTWAFARAEPQSRPVGATPRPEVRSAATPDGKREGAPRTVEARPMKRQQDVTQV
jgi:formate-dependent nitrite reductase membrane component NrfD